MTTVADIRVVVETATVRAGRGPHTGAIWFVIGDKEAFPGPGWSDFIVVVLGWWLASILRMLSGEAHAEQFLFMEGPYLVQLSRASGSLCKFSACERRGGLRVLSEVQVDLERLAESLLLAAQVVMSACGSQQTTDTRTLQDLISALTSALSSSKGG